MAMSQAQIEATLRTLEKDRDELRIQVQRLKAGITHLAASPSDDMSAEELAERASDLSDILEGNA